MRSREGSRDTLPPTRWSRRRIAWISAVIIAVGIVLAFAVYYLSSPALTAGQFLVEDSVGDRMVIEVNASRQQAIDALLEMHAAGTRKWVGGEVERYDNEFGFRFKPETIIVADFTAEALQAGKYRTIQEDFEYWQGLGTVYVLGKVVGVPRG